ncbi:hypothetical protein NQ318_001176 [Aromia moschata]|uniref:Maturase K n=1 Tax=Aromia moschata TaxID=1265417 RepID=A0AAV8ZH43_9CUCU|nr:hypothetical protein NQ318_001176 [Aromia moschata]
MNSVNFLLTNKDITYEIRTEIKRLGRPIPDLIISKTDVGKSRNYSRHFNSSVYDSDGWQPKCMDSRRVKRMTLKILKIFACGAIGNTCNTPTSRHWIHESSFKIKLKFYFLADRRCGTIIFLLQPHVHSGGFTSRLSRLEPRVPRVTEMLPLNDT